MIAIQVFLEATPLKTRAEVDEWLDEVVMMRDSSGVTRIVGISGPAISDVLVTRKRLDACMDLIAEASGGTVPASMASIMELRGVFADEAPSALSHMAEHRHAVLEMLLSSGDDDEDDGVMDVYEILLESLQALCDGGGGEGGERGEGGVLVFD